MRPQLEAAYSKESGRAAIEPVLLLGVCLLQHLEGVPDRLQEHDLAAVGFKAILDGLVDAGLVQRRTHQRMDSTHVLGLVSRMSRVECVRESIRLALEEVAARAPAGPRPAAWQAWWERYVESQLDYRASHDVLVHKLLEAGADAQALVAWARDQGDLARGEAVGRLAEVFGQPFAAEAGQPLRTRGKGELDSGRIQNPHDPDATWSAKGTGQQQVSHVGYKVQVAESVEERRLEPGEPTAGFVVGVVTQPAHHSDEAGARTMAAEQASMGLGTPPVLYADGAYVSAERLARARAEAVEIIGPAQGALRRRPGAFTAEDFDVRIDERRATCPAGAGSTQCSRLDGEKAPGVQYRLEWNQGLCRGCPMKDRCLGPGQGHRTLVVGEHHMELQRRRKEQREPGFRERMRRRNAIEGTHSELVRAHGLRRARYRGLGRVRLGNDLAAAACNIQRWLRRVAWEAAMAGGMAGRATATATG